MKRSVNHELHALNLAERIVRIDRVPWVEIKEVQGRFSVRATLQSDGKVHASLASSRYNIQRKRRLETPWKTWLGALTIVFLVGFGIWSYAVFNQPARVPEQLEPPGQNRVPRGRALPSVVRNEKNRTEKKPVPARRDERAARATAQSKSKAPAGPNGRQSEQKETPKVSVESGPARGESQGPSAPPEEAFKPTAPLAGPTSNPTAEQYLLPGLRVFLTDRKSWEASGGFTRGSSTSPEAEHRGVRPPKPDYLKSFRERCPAAVVSSEPEKANYIVLLDHSEWHSPPYKVAVFRRNGDLIYSGGTQLLRNAVKNVCAAVTTATR